jgi:cytochrome c-type biogenesis protein CcsB
LGAAAVAILTGALVSSGLQAGHWPVASEYEFALAFALGTALAVLAPGRSRDPGRAATQATTMSLAALLVAYAWLGLPGSGQTIEALAPILQSVWLPLHAGAAALSFGALAMAGVGGAVWLVRAGGLAVKRGQDLAPTEDSEHSDVQWLVDRAFAAGFPLLTLSMIFGMIWAQVAWGRYWVWDLQEIWTMVPWLIGALFWHVRRRPRWQRRRLAWLAVAGLGSVLFTFLGVERLARTVNLESLHLF